MGSLSKVIEKAEAEKADPSKRTILESFGKHTEQFVCADCGKKRRYYDMLAPGGYLFLGHSEQLADFQKYFKILGKTSFQKLPSTGLD